MVVEQKWQIFPNQLEISQKISATLNRHSILGQILLNRKIGSIQEAEDFLGAVPASGESSRLPQFEEAAAVIEAAVSEGLPILIYGDYDVDGMTSTTMLTDFLRKLGADVTFFIPHRFKDGYGLQSSIISLMKQKEIGLLVTLDCGVTSVREITQIKAETGAKVVVMDHHTIPEIQPPFDAMINPKALEESHPMFHLCTAGIVYHFVCQFNAVYEKGLKPEYYIDLAALGTIADVARLIGENRSLVRRGLRALSAQRRFGIKAILDVAKFNRSQVSTRDVGFTIAPRLNAAGRLDNATKGVDLLLSTSYDKAFKIAERLETLNNERRYMGLTMMNESVALLKSQKKWEQNPIIGLASSEWHAGVIGIIAARMAE
ncbi:MAG: single-stranded-DNA-specific exonuclease, partial [Candidatus Marinamargulisbacteria bacterium]